MSDYKFYMSRYVGSAWENAVDIEEKFLGLRVAYVEGLSEKGDIENIYVENYAENRELRVLFPENIVRKSTEIKMVVCFSGLARRDIYDSFVKYLEGKRLKYWDTCRMREVEMFLRKSVNVDEDVFIGNNPYILATFVFQNYAGDSKKKEPTP